VKAALFLLVLLPFAASVAALAMPNAARRQVAWLAGATALAGLALAAWVGTAVLAGEVPAAAVPWMPALGVDFGFRVDGFAWLFVLLIYGIGALVVLYAAYYLAEGDPPARFFAFLLAFMGAMLGVATADNLRAPRGVLGGDQPHLVPADRLLEGRAPTRGAAPAWPSR
jgi:multicomponent K+:H+ antiporter subunit A